jgi:poly(3-hydroxybutyrate) depolymerase
MLRRSARTLLRLALVCGVATAWHFVHAAGRLPALDADPAQTSISGLSSGAYMALQFEVVWSSVVRGSGIIAGGPYLCSGGSVFTAAQACMQPSAGQPLPRVADLKAATEALARRGVVDPTRHLRTHRVWMFHGSRDAVLATPVMDAVQQYLAGYVDPATVVYEKGVAAGHAMVTETYGEVCDYNGTPYIDHCGFDAAGKLLAHVYGSLFPPARTTGGVLQVFDQNEFAGGDAYAHSLADTGYAYIPRACANAGCRIHVALHGCQQSEEAVGDAFYRHAGYNRWADDNRIIVLYPQTIARYGAPWPPWRLSFVYNPQGCWDWWGYDGTAYATRDGAQIRAIKGMIDRLAEPRR